MAASFTFEPVDDGISVGGPVSLALDRAGNPRIAFSQQGSGQIIVATRNGGAWTLDNVPGAFAPASGGLRLAIDSKGDPQIAFLELSSGELVHAVKSAGRWSSAHIPTRLTPDHQPGGVGAIDFALHPGRLDTQSRDVGYFAYVDLASQRIGFAHTAGVGPTPVLVEDQPHNTTEFAGPSAAFDPSENFFIAYVGVFASGAAQASVSVRSKHIVDIEKGTFSNPPTIVDGSQSLNVRTQTSIVRTFSDGCVVYFDMASKTLKASVSDLSGLSAIETVAANLANIVSPSAAAKQDEFRVAYGDADAMMLPSRSKSGDWTVEAVEAVSGGPPSLAYDNASTANIAYAAGARLRYARRAE
ncbi:MAG TPA: hypothetical protein VGG79_23280 [Roseiarcus sp.]|jgi:hypothetical protein